MFTSFFLIHGKVRGTCKKIVMVGRMRDSWWEEGRHSMKASLSQPDMMQCMVDRRRALQLSTDKVIVFS